MTPQDYILSQLERLKEPVGVDDLKSAPKDNAAIANHIYRVLMSKKFRKFSVPETSKTNIRTEIIERVARKEPILINCPFGGYKLWRLEETPEADWAEFFSIMYHVRWLKPICDAYPPGVRLLFRFDEVVIEKLSNIPESETQVYRVSFERVLSFLKSFVPHNLQFEIFLERSRYENYETFEKELAAEMKILQAERAKNPRPLSQSEIDMIELNVRPKPEQTDDPEWREKVDLAHIAYYNLQEHKIHPIKHYMDEGIIAFPTMFEAPNLIAVGTTKTSVVKFWVGVGALKKRGDSYIETVLSPSQLKNTAYSWTPVVIDGLEGKNFNRLRIINV